MLQSTSLTEVLSRPSPEALWHLRAELLEQGIREDSRTMVIVDEFYGFMNQLVASSTARQYSHIASLLDMTAVAGVAIENLVDRSSDEAFWQRFVVGAVSEATMVLAARQYVKTWEVEMRADYNSAAWFLAQEYWRLSADLQPELEPARRRELIDRLFGPLTDEEVEAAVKVGLIGRLFQMLLIAQLQIDSQ